MSWDQEELVGLCILLLTVVGLSLAGKLTHESVEGIKWVGVAFMGSKGMANFLPDRKE